jgi:hypothetical protein
MSRAKTTGDVVPMVAKSLTGLLVGGALALLAAMPAWSQDELRVRQLENEVSRLQRELEAQSRRIEELERDMRSAGGRTLSPPPPDVIRRTVDDSPAWLVSTNWDRIRKGMKDVDVIALLGRPTSVREEPDGKGHALLYALEIGPTSVLAGNVHISDSGVSEINKPTLR